MNGYHIVNERLKNSTIAGIAAGAGIGGSGGSIIAYKTYNRKLRNLKNKLKNTRSRFERTYLKDKINDMEDAGKKNWSIHHGISGAIGGAIGGGILSSKFRKV